MVRRRTLVKAGITCLAFGLPMLAPGHFSFAGSETLSFDPDAFTELTETITTGQGDKVVTYRFYRAIPYVARPLDVAYQSLNISVPTAIDGAAIDASNAPILFANYVGGYMPSSVAEAKGVGGGQGMPPPGLQQPHEANTTEVPSGGAAMLARGGEMVSNAKLALAAGCVVVEAGARGRTLTDAYGVYYGVAPAAIIDLKAAIRYLRFNDGTIPGNMDFIVSSGTSAGGALSALLGASGDSEIYLEALDQIGAADASDAIFACGAWCPITDLGNADIAYEWNWGKNPLASGELVDQTVSAQLAGEFPPYQAGLELEASGFGRLTADNLGDYLLATFLQPSADRYLASLSNAEREAYLANNPFISYVDGRSSFTWADFKLHVGARKKSVPAFDAFDLSTGENNLFGVDTIKARHFTDYSLRHASGDPDAQLDVDIPRKLEQMNPMDFLLAANPGRSRRWWLRSGTRDTDTSLSVMGNLAAAAMALGDDVDAAMYWDAGHGANEDADDFIAWIKEITGYRP